MDPEDLRVAVYDLFRRGHIPRVATLGEDLSVATGEVTEGLATLAAQRNLALGTDGEITMAHPFTAVPLGFSVMGDDTLWWGGFRSRQCEGAPTSSATPTAAHRQMSASDPICAVNLPGPDLPVDGRAGGVRR